MSVVVRVTLLLTLLALSQAQATEASLSIFWRTAVLSFDNPGTQHCDEAASTTVPHADPASEAIAHLEAAAATAHGRAGALAGLVRPVAAVSSGTTRAPPAVQSPA